MVVRIADRALGAAAAFQFTAVEEMDLALRVAPLAKLGVANRCRIIPNGIVMPAQLARSDQAHCQALLQRFPELRGKRLVLFLGRIIPGKGLDILTRAFAQLCRQRTDVHLVIAGPDNEGHGRLVRRWLQAEGTADRATFTGLLLGAEKEAAFGLATIFVLPSYSENFAIAAVEAMAHGLAVIITNRVKIWRDVAAARAATVINCNAEELAGAIARLLEDHQARREMGERARQLAAALFSSSIAAEQVLDLYHSIAFTGGALPQPGREAGAMIVDSKKTTGQARL
jgi:glycosyltransferase involved in cell wall biosynthesis